MKRLRNIFWFQIGFLLALIIGIAYAHAGDLPDSKLTPGVARQVDVRTLCTTSTKLVRNVTTATKKAAYKEYGLKGNSRLVCKQGYEVDHLISLELGGSNDLKNLWPQNYCGTNNAHIKDALENELHKRICNGQITMQNAQTCISTNWINCYKDTFK